VTSHVFDVAHALERLGHELAVAGPASGGPLPQNGYTHHLGGTFRLISPGDGARINLNPLVFRPVRALLASRTLDVVHLHEPFLPFIGPAFLHLADAVKVGTFHTWREGPHIPYISGWPFVRYWNRLLDGRIAVSEPARQTVMKYVDGDYEIIPNGVDFDRFASPEIETPAAFRDDRPTLLFVGRIESRKGITYLLDAYGKVKRRYPEARLVIVGDGGLRPKYEALSRELGLEDVHFEGYVEPERLPGYYRRADVFCSPSTVNESFGITLLEAMAAGTPVVATAINGRDTLGEDGVTGLIVPPKDGEAMADAALRLLDDRDFGARLSAAAQERARRFDWDNVAQRLVSYYETLISRR
jgi:phosphatidylinositol alpha-mannosyltransferase